MGCWREGAAMPPFTHNNISILTFHLIILAINDLEDVVCRYLSLFLLYINIKKVKIDVKCEASR